MKTRPTRSPYRDSTTPVGPNAALAYLERRHALAKASPPCMTDHPAVIAALMLPRGVTLTRPDWSLDWLAGWKLRDKLKSV